MVLTRRNMTWLTASLLVLSAPAAATDGATGSATAEAETVRAWHAPAAATAEAAAAKTQDAVVPPAPKPAERPPAAETAAKPKDATKAAAPAAPIPATPAADAKAGKDKAKGKDAPKKPVVTAKQLFGTVKTAAPLAARAVGWYAKGCLAGGKPIAVDGPGWQVMRLSRNRNWGHPNLIALIERLAKETTAAKEWPGLLVGDISQPRGGPMISGHSSHQVGLDADIWLTPMPDRTLTRREREDMSAVSMLANHASVDSKVWGSGQEKLIKRAASYPEVERILVHPALKKALCESAGTDRTWLSKVRPYFGHYYHFHVRIGCPKGSTNCQAQPPVPSGDGCDTELEQWLKRVAPKPKKPKPPVAEKPPAPKPPAKPAPPKPEITLADLPPDCSAVLTAGGHVPPTVPAVVVDRSKNAAPVQDVAAEKAADPAATPAATPAKSQ